MAAVIGFRPIMGIRPEITGLVQMEEITAITALVARGGPKGEPVTFVSAQIRAIFAGLAHAARSPVGARFRDERAVERSKSNTCLAGCERDEDPMSQPRVLARSMGKEYSQASVGVS